LDFKSSTSILRFVEFWIKPTRVVCKFSMSCLLARSFCRSSLRAFLDYLRDSLSIRSFLSNSSCYLILRYAWSSSFSERSTSANR
jgi:hypothetical protein